VCGACNWYNTGYCCSLQIINHLLSTTGEHKTFLDRDYYDSPILSGCFMRASSPVTATPRQRPRHNAPSSTTQFISKPPSPVEMVGESLTPKEVSPVKSERSKRSDDAVDIDQVGLDLGRDAD
jgi:hypothetical protein